MRNPSAFLAPAVALFFGCSSPTKPPAGLVVTASVLPVPATVGAPLRIDVTVANSSANEYRVSGSAGGCFAIVEVRDAHGDVVPDANPRVCDAASVQHPVTPSGTLVDRLSFSGLAVGAYRVRARVGVLGYGELRSPEYALSVGGP